MPHFDIMKTGSHLIVDSDLSSLEEWIGAPIPPDLRSFYLQSDGGIFTQETIDISETLETTLNQIFSVVSSQFENIRVEYHDLKEDNRIPRWCLPIGDDPAGNLFIISLEDETYGAIYYWDHEREQIAENETIAAFENLTLIADSFSEFVKKIR